MKNHIPERFSKEAFRKLTENDLNTNTLRQYRRIVTESYRKTGGGSEYLLREDLSEEDLIRLDFIFRRIGDGPFDSLEEVARYFRMLLEVKKSILLFAYNGTGKTRLSAEFRKLGQSRREDRAEKTADTLYYNAFTEDLFSWDNDLENDRERFLKLNSGSRFFAGLKELEMESRIRPFLRRYVDFDFTIDYDHHRIHFFRDVMKAGVQDRIDNIKVSRGEENLFIWCFFLAIVQLAADREEAYSWVRYIYIDDPISSLDDNNAVAVASHLAALLKASDVKVVVSSHHALFYNVLCNEMNNPEQLFLQRKEREGVYLLKKTEKTPFFHHIAMLKELQAAAISGEIYSYHFNMLRNVLEKTASFHGYKHFSDCLRKGRDEDSPVHKRMLDLLSHGNYSVFEPKELVEDNKIYFRTILDHFLEDYKFNRKILDGEGAQEEKE